MIEFEDLPTSPPLSNPKIANGRRVLEKRKKKKKKKKKESCPSGFTTVSRKSGEAGRTSAEGCTGGKEGGEKKKKKWNHVGIPSPGHLYRQSTRTESSAGILQESGGGKKKREEGKGEKKKEMRTRQLLLSILWFPEASAEDRIPVGVRNEGIQGGGRRGRKKKKEKSSSFVWLPPKLSPLNKAVQQCATQGGQRKGGKGRSASYFLLRIIVPAFFWWLPRLRKQRKGERKEEGKRCGDLRDRKFEGAENHLRKAVSSYPR